MGTGYTRNDTANNIADGNIINASDLDGEFDAVQSAFNASTGHTHDGTTGEGAPIEVIGPTQDVVATASVLRPKTDNTVDLGTTTLEYKDLFLDGTAHIDTLDVDENASITGTLGVTGAATLSSTLGVTGAATLSSTLGVTGATTLSSTLGVTGAATLSSTLAVTGAAGIDGDFDINTNKFTVASATGNTVVAGTLGVTGATTATGGLNVDTISEITSANGVVIDGVTLKDGGATVTADINFGDNDKAIFGAGSDLQIYHTGSYSLIADTSGTGPLRVVTNTFQLNNAADTENMINAAEGGAVTLYNAGAAKLATTSTGIDVTGTVTADGLTVDGDVLVKISSANYTEGLTLRNTANWGYGTSLSFEAITSSGGSNAEVGRITSTWNTAGYHGLDFYTLNNNTLLRHMRLDGYGDFSLYEDTGTTAKFFWDASAESLGIGTSSPSNSVSGLHVSTASSTDQLYLERTGSATAKWYLGAAANSLYFHDTVAASTRMIIDSSGNVGIKNSVMSSFEQVGGANLLVLGSGAGSQGMTIYSGNTGVGSIAFADGTTTTQEYEGLIQYSHSTNSLALYSNHAERMRIDSNGNVGIGVVPDAWSSTGAAIQLEGAGHLATANQYAYIGSNYYYNAGWKYTTSSTAAQYRQDSGTHQWLTAASGTADAALTWSEAMRIDSSGNVGIGTTSLTQGKLCINGGSDGSSIISGRSDGGNGNNERFKITAFADGGGAGYGGGIGFETRDTVNVFYEAMRIDSSGNLLVGTTTTDTTAAAGFTVQSDGQLFSSADSQHVATMTRLTNDGDILTFRRSAIGGAGLTTVGSIGTATNEFEIKSSGSRYLELQNIVGVYDSAWTGTLQMTPTVSSVDLGSTSTQWDNLFLSGGVYLGGTGSANLLDDYEEGTWTPTFSSSSFATGITVNNAHYVKIGDLVNVTAVIGFTGTTGNYTVGDNYQLGGLPFSMSDTHGRNGSGWASASSNRVGFNNLAQLTYIAGNVTSVYGTLARTYAVTITITYKISAT